jgi:hypothetical protein
MYSYARINTNTSAKIGESGPTRLVRVVINTKGASSNKLDIYDGSEVATGTKVASIDTTSAVGNIEYDLILNKGLFINIPNVGTAADVTIVYG